MDEDRANANSELRYIALELTKISQKQKKPFQAVAAEFVQNVYELENMLRTATVPRVPTQKTARSKVPRE
jgi:hypothetical protein